jgi:hypothetical protein
VHVYVGIFDPSHDLFICSKIGTETVDLWPNETLFGELHCVSSGDLFNFTLRVVSWVDFDSTFSTTEWDISNSELEGHEGCERHHFLKIDTSIVSCASLDWKFVMLVLGTVASDVLNCAVVTTDGDGESDNVVAGTDEFKIVLADTGLGCGAVEEEFDLLEETGFFVVGSGGEGTDTYKNGG